MELVKGSKICRLPVLLYHDIDETGTMSHSSIHPYDLSRQFYYLKSNGFTTISVKQLIDYIDFGIPLPEKPVLLTFDDGHKSIRTILYPLLLQHKMKATAFLVPSLVNSINASGTNYLSVQEIKDICEDYLEWGIHSYDHSNYKKLTTLQVAQDIRLCIHWFQLYKITFSKALAFPFGAYPKYNRLTSGNFFLGLYLSGIKLSFGTGSGLNLLNKKRPVFLKRLEITGKEDMGVFASYLREGKKNIIERFFSNLVTPVFNNLRYLYNGE